ncbi:MAG: DUF4258 domain-containing protein [Spirochaetales bacterium]|nr:DUF4258 domain-containing protein [Spirochaetales bacterium]
MTGAELLVLIRSAIKNDRLRWSQHASVRLMQRRISIATVVDTIEHGEAIEFYGNDDPFPSVLVAHITDAPLHVVVAYDEHLREAHVVTAYRPDVERFEDDFKTRRRMV